jgi:hypothetical protein
MPGLVGIVSLGGDKLDPGLVKSMRDAIRHRDWYQVDDYVDAQGTVAISRVHLGIINKDRQPYSARSGQVQVFLIRWNSSAIYTKRRAPSLHPF